MAWVTAAVIAAGLAAVMGVRTYRLKKEIYDFTDRLEEDLDRLLADRERVDRDQEKKTKDTEGSKDTERAKDTEDTLYGKINEKLGRVSHVWELRRLENQREKERMKELISDISHQTKTPIANQKLCVEILRQEALSKQGKESLIRLEKQTDKLDFLFQSMVKMSRLETGIIQIKKQKGNLVETLGAAASQIVERAEKKQISLYVDCAEEVLLNHDPKWTEEAFFNILDNGVKYTDEGGSIRITVTEQEIFTKISIQDTGKGIRPERQSQIFTRFYREPEVHGQEGIGIGLYLAREIIELQKGYIEVRSQEGEGAEFHIYLPREESHF